MNSVDGSTKLHIAFVIKGLGLGGAELVVLQTAIFLRDRGYVVSVVNLDPGRDEMRPRFIAADFSVYDIPVTGILAPLVLARLCHLLVRRRVDIIHAHLPMAGIIARLAGRLTGRPVLYTEHSVVDRYNPLTRLLNRLSYPLNDAVIAVSAAVAQSIDRAMGGRARPLVQVITNGIVSTARLPGVTVGRTARWKFAISEQSFVFGTVASLRPLKRIDLLLAAFASLGGENGGPHLIVVGGGQHLESLQDLAGTLGIADRVHFAGWQQDPAPYLQAMDAYVICSDWEGLPMALLEAMAQGKTVLATAVGGIPSVVKDRVNGLLVPPGDERALARAMEAVMHNPGLRAALASRAAVDADRDWNFEDRAFLIERLILDICGPSRVRTP